MFCKMLQNFCIFSKIRRCNSFAFVLKSKCSIANFLQKFTKVLSLNGKEWYSMWQHSNAKLLQKNRQRDKKTQNLYKIKQKVQRFFWQCSTWLYILSLVERSQNRRPKSSCGCNDSSLESCICIRWTLVVVLTYDNLRYYWFEIICDSLEIYQI